MGFGMETQHLRMTLTIIWIEYQIHVIRHYSVRSFIRLYFLFSRFDCAIVFVMEVSIFKQLCYKRKLIIAGSQHLEVNNHHHCSPLSLHIWSIFYYIYYISRVNHLQPQPSRPHSLHPHIHLYLLNRSQ